MDACCGIDIGGTNTVLGLVDSAGEVLAEARLATTAGPEFTDLVDALARELQTLVERTGCTLRGIGIGAPKGSLRDGSMVCPSNLPWAGVLPLASLLRERVPGPSVHVTNDANAAALGELLYGGAQGLRDFLLVTLGTGVGGGFVANGALLTGPRGFAGELGHVVVDWEGRPCGCGRRGCLETYASVTGLVRTAAEKLAASDSPSLLREVPGLTGRAISTAAREGDTLALEVFEDTGRCLGRALANAVALTSPERIFVFGGLARAGDLLLEPTQRHLDASLLGVFAGEVRLELSHLMDRNAAILGAAALAWREGPDPR